MNFNVVESLTDRNTFFLFRYTIPIKEIRIEIKSGLIKPSEQLLPEESNYLREQYLTKINKQ